MKTLVILAHPQPEKSIANKRIATQLAQQEDVVVRDIFQLYPDYNIDTKAEQEALLQAETVIFQYPFWWYNMPAILKQWFDIVFDFNFAYGPEGDKLKGKNFMLSFTIGGPADAYTPLGYNHFRIEDFTKPMEQTAYLAQMNWLKPVYQHSMVFIPGVYNTQEAVEQGADEHAQRVIEILNELNNDDPERKLKAFVKDWFAQMDILAEDGYFNTYIANGAKMVFPEGTFIGHDGFKEWYADIKSKLKPNCEHRVESINITPTNDFYKVDLSVKLKAETTDGKAMQANVKEAWKVEITRDGRVKIHEYVVTEV
jgi:putative NADPH-quinone reductase/ketosteroid isomerase-like protein